MKTYLDNLFEPVIIFCIAAVFTASISLEAVGAPVKAPASSPCVAQQAA